MKRISLDAYQALREALGVITWYKRPFESLLKAALRDTPELLAGLNFSEPKKIVADQLVQRLVDNERKYQAVTLQLMVEIAAMERFPDIEQIKDVKDRDYRLAETRAAVARLKALTKVYAAETAEQEKQAAQRELRKRQAELTRRFGDELDELKQAFMEQQKATDVHKRGYDLEKLLQALFHLYDMQPRPSYVLEREQIDGSLNFDTDDYIVEARWRAEQVDRAAADVFASKVRRKGKNALGLMVSITGFTPDAIDQYRESTPFIALDGSDLSMVLDQRVRLDDLLRAKLRHANETGSCFLSAATLIA